MQLPSRSASVETIQSWLVLQVASHAKVDPTEIDILEPFSRYGLDSLSSVTLVANLESWLENPLPATLFWDYPTIEDLARYLAAEAASLNSVG
ncbi:MAG TPA: acyl carrier protein [Symbiobacteriaceae bacterium]|nr:acyl carrier protein [Symbiobacteriaceae bacterium]